MLCWIWRTQSFFHPCDKLLFFRRLLHDVFCVTLSRTYRSTKYGFFSSKLLNFKLPAMVQKIFACASTLLQMFIQYLFASINHLSPYYCQLSAFSLHRGSYLGIITRIVVSKIHLPFGTQKCTGCRSAH